MSDLNEQNASDVVDDDDTSDEADFNAYEEALADTDTVDEAADSDYAVEAPSEGSHEPVEDRITDFSKLDDDEWNALIQARSPAEAPVDSEAEAKVAFEKQKQDKAEAEFVEFMAETAQRSKAAVQRIQRMVDPDTEPEIGEVRYGDVSHFSDQEIAQLAKDRIRSTMSYQEQIGLGLDPADSEPMRYSEVIEDPVFLESDYTRMSSIEFNAFMAKRDEERYK